MDLIGHADPYFIAKIDNYIQHTFVVSRKNHILLIRMIFFSFRSKTINNTDSPVWNEEWIVRNIPRAAKMTVKVYDEDDDKIFDDFIGEFEINNLIDFEPPENGILMLGPLGFEKGNFRLTITSKPSDRETSKLPSYTFDGPCQYSRHDSMYIGLLTKVNPKNIYSTWKIQLRRISHYFPPFLKQHWNRNYAAAQKIFGHCPSSLASQSIIRAAHVALHGRKLKHYEIGILNNVYELWNKVFTEPGGNQVRPCLFTYVIDEEYLRFGETGHRFFTDFASKHALLANASEYVRYAGEFHVRPVNGWHDPAGEWEIVFDNGSGTYSPSADLLENLKDLIMFNFPGLKVTTYDYQNPKLKESVKKLKKAMKRYEDRVVTMDDSPKPQQLITWF